MLTSNQQQQFVRLRKDWIERQFNNLNPRQQEGVLTTEGPLLLLAGAGSGKTTVLIHRIANLLRFGRASDSVEVPNQITEDDLNFLQDSLRAESLTEEEQNRADVICRLDPVLPWQIIAITFTNKAASELKQRLESKLGPGAQDIWAATFHSACVRILRRDIDKLGFSSSFTIYDTDDSLRVIKESLKELNMDEKSFPPRAVLNKISKAKDRLQLARDYKQEAVSQGDYRLQKIADIYTRYEKKLWSAGALDFDDIIFHTVRLLQEFPEVREFYQRKFRYVLIDEYQDTNHLQYLLAALLAGGRKNICVVGDDDQSIYRFRGATIENILSFENEYQNARVIRLEQNYRSTGNILNAANSVIRNNRGRKGKNLWTQQGEGEKVQFHTASNEREEGQFVASQLLEAYRAGIQWKDCAVLYRMNALSNQIEIAIKSHSIPYRVIGGFRFFERAEVKDMLSYLSVIHNPADDLRLLRVINNPPRGLGAKSIETARQVAEQESLHLWDVIENAGRWDVLKKSAAKFRTFVELIKTLQQECRELPLTAVYANLVERSGYAEMLKGKKDSDSKNRLENVQELSSSISAYLDNAEEPSLGGFLDEIALYTDLDAVEDDDNCVTLMTMHAAKGLEFPIVFAVGMEEGVFPGYRSIGESEELEEERRLCYVAMTRAKEKLYLTCAAQRMLFGRTSGNLPSRFVKEIPDDCLEQSGRTHSQDRISPLDRVDWGDPYDYPGENFSQIPVSRGDPYRNNSSASRNTHRAAYRQPSRPAQSLPSLQKGDMLQHTAFGTGMVLSVQPMGGDALVEIAFDSVGTKRMMLKAAAKFITKV